MPSMMFFMKRESQGKVSHAIRRLMRNLLLLLHILFILGLAAALAEPYLPGFQQADNTVVVFDVSASMSDDLANAKEFANSNLGQRNTLIVTGREVSVPLKDASATQVRNYIRNIETRDVKTDVAAGLETVNDYEGQVILASDLDQTVNSRRTEQLVKQLQQDRNVKILETVDENSWGIIDVEPGRHNSTIDVKNFGDDAAEITVRTDKGGRRIQVDSDAVETVTVATEPGMNTVMLEDDGMTADNTAYISIPEEREFEVMYIADRQNPYLEKVVELVPFTRYDSAIPPVRKDLNADIYVIGKTDRLLKSTAEEIEAQVENGAGLVLFAQAGLSDKGFKSAPRADQRNNASVEILQPVRANVGHTQVYELKAPKFESFSSPRQAVMKKSYGQGEVIVYNIKDEDFRHDFLYPIFWKEVFADLAQRPSVNQLNLETGDTINESEIVKPGGTKASGRITLVKSGYYNTSSGIYAANLESEDESEADEIDIESDRVEQEGTRRNVQNLGAMVLALLAVLELLYLMRIGEV